ncbi:MAG: hypothetical protein ACJASU_001614 [Cognaticolwellia sp.]
MSGFDTLPKRLGVKFDESESEVNKAEVKIPVSAEFSTFSQQLIIFSMVGIYFIIATV